VSNDYHRPTMTFPKGGYNASQVRLYGLASSAEKDVRDVGNASSTTFSIAAGGFDITVSVSEGNKIEGGGLYASHISISMKKLGTVVMTAAISKALAQRTGGTISCGVIVSYAFEGHTYDLPKPKIMILPVRPEPTIPEDDSGFKEKETEGYAVWLVDKLDECAEFEMNQGFIEQLVLEANLPGKRAPNMYVGRMMLGHRGGKLSE
jgi:hypothetical protein